LKNIIPHITSIPGKIGQIFYLSPPFHDYGVSIFGFIFGFIFAIY